jgi:hypothetical protein
MDFGYDPADTAFSSYASKADAKNRVLIIQLRTLQHPTPNRT